MSRSRGIVAPPPEFTFVFCVPCRAGRKRGRIGRAVSICRTCDQELCDKHLDACGCPPWMQLGLAAVAP